MSDVKKMQDTNEAGKKLSVTPPTTSKTREEETKPKEKKIKTHSCFCNGFQ